MKAKLNRQKAPKLLDCTLRDGGIVNDSNFDDDFVKYAVRACADARFDYIEVGFCDSERFCSPKKYGKWRFCRSADIAEALADKPGEIKIAALADAGKCDWRDFPAKSESPIDMMRCAFYRKDTAEAVDIVNSCADKGYATALCMMAATTLSERELEESLQKFSKTQADIIYLMDSFGALVPERARQMSRAYAEAAHSSGKLFAIHCHNNLQCAFANTLAAVECGADMADCTIGGLGKGAGNCMSEMLAMYFDEKCDVRPLLKFAQDRIVPMRAKYDWGFSIPYMLTGLNGIHPRPAMEFSEAKKGGKNAGLEDFYSMLPPELRP